MSAIDKMVEWFGSQAEVARTLKVSASAVTQWIQNGAIPAQRAIQIEALTKGQIKAVELVAQVPQ
jgi:DNA-binding transcriptional regulator YdaS (Cro superfamily)